MSKQTKIILAIIAAIVIALLIYFFMNKSAASSTTKSSYGLAGSGGLSSLLGLFSGGSKTPSTTSIPSTGEQSGEGDGWIDFNEE